MSFPGVGSNPVPSIATVSPTIPDVAKNFVMVIPVPEDPPTPPELPEPGDRGPLGTTPPLPPLPPLPDPPVPDPPVPPLPPVPGTVKYCAEMALPAAVVTVIGPVAAATGTFTVSTVVL